MPRAKTRATSIVIATPTKKPKMIVRTTLTPIEMLTLTMSRKLTTMWTLMSN
jgi:hypothetical protein